jgi:hypothetical protein
MEATPSGRIVWQYGFGPNDFSANSIIGCNDSQRVGNMTLMAGTGTAPNTVPQNLAGAVDNRVILVDRCGRIVWQYGQFGVTGSGFNQLNTPVQCTFVRCRCCIDDCFDRCRCNHNSILRGTVIISDQGNNRIIEVNEKNQIVWSYPGTNTNPSDALNSPNSAERLVNGHTLIADEDNNRALEVNKHDQVIKVFTASGTLGACAFASRLPNGNTLLTDSSSNSRIVEVDKNDNIVWQYITNADAKSLPNPAPTRALRLRNGDTLISNQYNNQVIRINETATIVATYGLPLVSTTPTSGFLFGQNSGYDTRTTQLGLYAPYDAKIIQDYTGITPP